jgi:2-oxoglutarate ferredoxin oxidoreductase subunit gamma
MKIRFGGFGGQGVVLCGVVFGHAAMLDGKRSLQTQSYGSASRGGLTRSDVCIESGEIYDLIYDELDALVALSQQSYDRYRAELTDDARILFESDMVEPAEEDRERSFGIPATDIAVKEFGRKVVANMIMMGFANEILGVVSHEALVAVIKDHVPPGTEELNERAYNEGRKLAQEIPA